jgi:hypothetical protein
MAYSIHKGVDKLVEFRGLSGQYLAMYIGIVVGALFLLAIFQLFLSWFIAFLIIVPMVVWGLSYVSKMNAKYGRYGVMQSQAYRNCPRYLISRKSFRDIIKVDV